MPRPPHPLIERERVIETALKLIDSEGLAACSLPRLGRELGVKAPSLYHHFEDRAEIMAEVARAIVLETPVPRRRDPEDWIEWFVSSAVNFRRTLLRHPNAAPILLEFVPRDLLSANYDSGSRFLTQAGVPTSKHVLIFDGIDNLMLGAGLVQSMKPANLRSRIFPHVDASREPALAEALDVNLWSTPEKLFAESIRAFLRGAVAEASAAE